MAFWTERSLNPKRKFRWVIEFTGGGNDENLKFAAKSVSKPSYDIGATQHKFINHTFNFPNRVVWQPVEVKLVDHVGAKGEDSVTQTIFGLLRGAGYEFPDKDTTNQCTLSFTKQQAIASSLTSVKISQLSGEASGDIIETWDLRNAWISKAAFGDLSYDDEGLVEISMTIVYDWAVLTPA